MLIRLLVLLCLLISHLGCDSLKNRTNQIALECGLDQKSVGQKRYLKLLSSSGTGYEDSDLKSLKIQFQDDQGEVQSLALTPRACVVMPNNSGILKAFDSKNSESLTRYFKSPASQNGLLTLNLVPKPEIQASLACPQDGLFATQTLSQPLFVNVSGEIAGLDIRLDLFNDDNSFYKTLFRKSMGEAELSLPEMLDVRDLKEGSYFLKVYGNHLSQGIDSRPLLLSEKLCRLNILRGTVYVSGLQTDSKPVVYLPRSRLPWTIQNSFEKLYVCQESRSITDPNEMHASEKCVAQNACTDPINYKEAVQINTEKVGVFNYFVYAENKAGRRSETSCQTVIVSDTAPALTVSWAHEDLKAPGSILRKPYAILQADIATQHELVQNSELENNLTCKVDFEIKGNNSFAENGVYCTEGRCKGKSLADFVPCDKKIGFTIVDALNQPMLMNSRLRLTVRSSDGAGNTMEAQNSVWINESTWVKETLSYTVDNKPLSLVNYKIDSSSDVLAVFSGNDQNYLAALTVKGWVGLKFDDLPSLSYKLARTRDGSIRIARSLRFGSSVKVDIFAYKNAQLTPLSITTEQNLIPNCINFHVGPDNATYCMNSTVNEAFQLINDQWVRISSPVDSNDPEAQKLVDWRILQDGRIAAISTSSIFIWNQIGWKKLSLNVETKISAGDLIEDFKGRLWVYLPPGEKSPGLYRIDSEKTVLYSAPLPLTRFYGGPTHPASSEGLTHFAADLLLFDFSTDTWLSDNYPISMLADLDDRHSMISDSKRTFVLLSDKGVFEGTQDLLYWPTKSLGYRANAVERDNDRLYFMDTSTNIQSLVRIESSFVSSFDSNMTGTADLRATGTWNNADGQTVLNFADSTQFVFLRDQIKKTKGPVQFKDALQVTALSAGRFCVSHVSGLWLYDPAKGIYENFVSDTGTGKNQQCMEDNTGKIWWWDFQDNTLHTFDGQKNQIIHFDRNEKEELKTLQPMLGQSQIVLATTQRLLTFNPDGSIKNILSLQDFESSQSLLGLQSFAKLGDSEIMLQATLKSDQRAWFTIDLQTGRIQEELDFARILGQFTMSRSGAWGNTVYLLTLSPNAVIMQRVNNQWKKISTRTDYQHITKNIAIYPWFFAVDTYGRVWFITNRTPFKLGRVDPEFAP